MINTSYQVPEEGNIIWLASYPKSGNTWLRIFLNNLLSVQEEPVDINTLHETGTISSNRKIFDEMVGVDSADLTKEEIDYYLPFVHTLRSEQLEEKEFAKIHDAYTKNREGQWLIPLEATYKVIYLIRNPLDVCVSFAHHSGHMNFDKTIKNMDNDRMTLKQSNKKQLHQYIGSWSDHVNSWTQCILAEKLLLIRYEDMKRKPQNTFTKIVQFLELKHTASQIAKALDNSKIEKLKEMEEEKGFRGKHQIAKRFFRKGIIGSWKEELTERQIEQVINNHREIMIRYDYLDRGGHLKI